MTLARKQKLGIHNSREKKTRVRVPDDPRILPKNFEFAPALNFSSTKHCFQVFMFNKNFIHYR